MGNKKQKNKARLDKFYFMAKEHGFRSRAAFKLIQLNKKYDFLSTAKCLVDLCAAPGGWLQVAAKYMPVASIKIGVDLAPIKPIKGVVTFQEDITTARCIQLIRKELKHFKADIVLNDGAPNVGADWAKDAYNQAELCLFALKVATDVLRKGGTFVTKVFRSKDYNSLLYVFNQLFNKVEATKPQASRTQSAEIFVVCQGYKAPDVIDPKFLDPKFALEEVEDEMDASKQITSLKKLLENKVNRGGYTENSGNMGTLYQETDFIEFLESQDPYVFLSAYNKFKIDDKTKDIFKTQPPPDEIFIICDDLKVCGRRELFSILKYRNKYQNTMEQQRKKAKSIMDKQNKELNKKEPTEAELEAIADKELEETIKRVEKERKRQDKREKIKKAKSEFRQKMSVIASTDIYNMNDEVLFDRRTLEKLHDVDIEELEFDESEEEEDENYANGDIVISKNAREREAKKNKKAAEDEGEDDDSDIDDNTKRINKMAEDIDAFYSSKKEYQGERDRKADKKDKKKKALIEQQRLKKDEVKQEKQLNNEDLIDEEGNRKVKFAKDIVDRSDSEVEASDDEDDAGFFMNPLLMKKQADSKKKHQDSDVEWSDEDESDSGKKGKGKKKEKEKDLKLGKRKNREQEDNDFFTNKEIEVVPQEKFEQESDMDSDDMAETRALAKVMLRKKARTEILDATYNRYATFDDEGELPDWFVQDERRNFRPNIPITKEQVMEEKRILKEYNERPSKKVTEAKARKKKRLAKAMNKIKQKAQVIAEQDINEGSKMRQIQKLYRKEKTKMKEDKKYVVSKSFSHVGKAKVPRHMKVVDKRMKKDLKMQKIREKQAKHRGKGGKKK
ncbi:pre-rrna processing protein ftsj3 [Stylonychia lemnae]|uniref:Putative rRNA methyltransferase n=1 Tax=Stylonychia lemnae TaxID=5949 RepID=A0A078AK98_STYLE|nr:pre-rrna processing protein ftsj3 [Stylonychia lemnae]|eukprot:CDW82321.1 pre-rrna processing protein ftsj3 [Stylonychia lemnae]